MKASTSVAIRIGPGHRTIAVPIRRQPRLAVLRLGSSSPKRLPITSTAGASVNEAISATNTPIAAGIPRLWKYGRRVK
jgi:hypothetical protein